MEYNLSNRSKTRLEGVHPFLVRVIEVGIKSSPEDFGIPMYGGLRTSADQRKLYDKGRTLESIEAGERVVTYVDGERKESNHQIKVSGYGEAFDDYIYDHATGRASWNADRLESVARHLQKIAIEVSKENHEWSNLRLEWGGDWTKFKDRPHFQLKRI